MSDVRHENFVMTGLVEHSLDTKGRVVIPADWWPAIPETGELVLMLRPDRAVAVLTPSAFERLMAKAREPVVSSNMTELRRLMATHCRTRAEASRRLTLPKTYRNYLFAKAQHPSQDIVLLGHGDWFEVFEANAFEDYALANFVGPQLREQASALGLDGVL